MVVSSLIRNKKAFLKSVSVHFPYFIGFISPSSVIHLPFVIFHNGFCKNISLKTYNMARTHFKHCLKSHLLFCTVVSLKANVTETAEQIPSIPRVRGERESKSQPEGELKLCEAPQQTWEKNKKIQKSYRQLKSLDTRKLEIAQTWAQQSIEM